LPPGRIAKLDLEYGHPPSFAISAHFIYKTVYVPTKIEPDGMPAFMLLSRSFQSAIAFQRSGGQGNGTNATGGFVDTISIIPLAFTLTQWLTSTIYEDKGA
jgi:hypothetical protein